MQSLYQFIQSRSDYPWSQRVVKQVVLILGMYPILSRQILSNNRTTKFEQQEDNELANGREAKHATRLKSKHNSDRDHLVPMIKDLVVVEKWHMIHFVAMMTIYTIALVQCLLIYLISFDALAEYHYLDCYMIGRFRFIGRTNKISISVLLTVLTPLMAFRFSIVLLRPKLSFHSVEFMLNKYEHVVEQERHLESSQRQAATNSKSSLAKLRNWSTRRVNTIESHTHTNTNIDPNPNFCFKNQLDGNSISEPKWILRPNRTSKSWIVISFLSHYGFYVIVMSVVAVMSFMTFALAGSIVTNLGFEMSYPTCVAYIQNKQQQSSATTPLPANTTLADNYTALEKLHNKLAYSHIYLAPERLAHQKRIEEIPAVISVSQFDWQSMTTYSMVRIGVDVIVNIYWYMELGCVVICVISVVFNCSIDVMLNADGVMKQLGRHIDKLIELREIENLDSSANNWMTEQQLFMHGLTAVGGRGGYLKSSDNLRHDLLSFIDHYNERLSSFFILHQRDTNFKPLTAASGSTERYVAKLEADSTMLQAIIVDHFRLVRDYSKMVSWFINFMLSAYVQYTLVIAYWTSSIKSRAVEIEFIIGEAIGTMIAMLIFFSAALARSLNFRLYKLIARAMAHDRSPESRQRWATIMNYYKPKSMYCFVLFGSIEISWLFCLKFISWMVSAFVVLASFSYMNRH